MNRSMYDAGAAECMTAGAKATGMLEVLVKLGYVPAHLQEMAREILDDWKNGAAKRENALNDKAEVVA